MSKPFKKLLNWRIILLVVFILTSLLAINYQFGVEGVAIRGVTPASLAEQAGFVGPERDVVPTNYEHITIMNGEEVTSLEHYYELLDSAFETGFLSIRTDNKQQGLYQITLTNKTVDDLGLTVIEAPKSNIKMGLDLAGGVRILLEPNQTLTSEQVASTVGALEKRLNVFGLADVQIRASNSVVGDGGQFFVVEMAGATLSEIEPLISRPGDFQARINNQTVFTADDILFVGKDSQSAAVQIQNCGNDGTGQIACPYNFAIRISPSGAQKFAQITSELEIVGSSLSAPIELYLDGVLTDSLSISAGLRGQAQEEISISGVGYGLTRDLAIEDASDSMQEMQILLESGKLPAKLSVVKADTLSADLGHTFLDNALLAGLFAVIVVSIVMGIRYRKVKIVIPAILTVGAELVLLFGFAALSRWNIDLASIAGLIIIIGTGFDHLIIIADQVNRRRESVSFKGSIKSAFRVILTAFFTTVVAMVPLFYAGAGLLQGFALTTIVGLCIAIFITRPAFAVMIE